VYRRMHTKVYVYFGIQYAEQETTDSVKEDTKQTETDTQSNHCRRTVVTSGDRERQTSADSRVRD